MRLRVTRSSTLCVAAAGGGSSRSRIFEEFLAAPEAEDPHALSDARKLLETLAPRQRDIVTSISLDGQSISATAKRLSMSEVAVRVALHRALKSLGAAWRRSVG
jgi:DNA-directed RNA polymerase specialized sigma24 family protein